MFCIDLVWWTMVTGIRQIKLLGGHQSVQGILKSIYITGLDLIGLNAEINF